MQVMAEFVRSDVTEDQILPILRQLLPVLMHILGDPAVSSVASFLDPADFMYTETRSFDASADYIRV
jgi:hypothetical protein